MGRSMPDLAGTALAGEIALLLQRKDIADCFGRVLPA
jgi:hypothetical protein